MSRILTVGLALGVGLLPAASGARANGYHRSCSSCGAAATTTRYYRTIHPVQYLTRYHDRSVYHYVTRLHYIVGVTRIQPIVHVDDVTRLHHLTVVRDAYAYPPQDLAPVPYEQPAPVANYGCGCGE